MFQSSLTEYTQWKESQGFQVHIVTAEWIQDNVEGGNLAEKVRNCIRQYYEEQGVKYVLLIGDSIDSKDATSLVTIAPKATLSTDWNLPAGYYMTNDWDVYSAKFTTVYFSDISNDTYSSSKAVGDYEVYVGVIPIRTAAELENVLRKTMNCHPTLVADLFYSREAVDQFYEKQNSKIPLLADSNQSVNLFYYGSDTSSELVKSRVFESQGVIELMGHGCNDPAAILIGQAEFRVTDSSRFRYINPLLITPACSQMAYWNTKIEYTCEAFLKSPSGPATIITPFPEGSYENETTHFSDVTNLSEPTKGFWQDLFEGKTVGQSLYDNVEGSNAHMFVLFGDPSLVAFQGSPKPSPTPSTSVYPTNYEQSDGIRLDGFIMVIVILALSMSVILIVFNKIAKRRLN